jgi:hypothetical protein
LHSKHVLFSGRQQSGSPYQQIKEGKQDEMTWL